MKAFGMDIIKKDVGYFGVRECSNCGKLVDVNLLELTGLERFCFLPVKTYVTKRYLKCVHCESLFTLSDEQWTHYSSYLNHRLTKKTTEEILDTLHKINASYQEKGIVIDIDNKLYHPALDDICDMLIRKYGYKENMEELISVYFIAQQNNHLKGE